MDSDSRFVVTPRMVLGVSIALLGVLLTLNRLGVAHIDHLFRRYWPVPIMVMGGLMFIQAQDGRDRMRGGITAGVGTWLFLNMQGLLSVRLWELFWPVILILVGINMAMRGPARWRHHGSGRRRGPFGPDGPFGSDGPLGPAGPFGAGGPMGSGQRSGTSPRPDRTANFTETSSETGTAVPQSASGPLSMFAVWSSTRRASSAQHFEGGDITAIMGGAQLDLRLAAIPAGRDAVIDVTTVMGGVELFVPAHWEVSTPIMPFLGAVEDERLPPIQTDAARLPQGRLVIRGFVLLGGLHIKS